MKTAEYKLPFGVHNALEPVETGRTEAVKDKGGNVILNEKDGKPGRPIYAYQVIKLREAETLQEFISNLVEQDKPEEHTLSLAQGQYDIIAQRKAREFFQGEECVAMLDGKHADTKDLREDERLAYVLGIGQEILDNYAYGSRPAGTGGGGNAAAKQALADKKRLDAAAEKDPAIAAKRAELEALLASLV